jgi:hypothetical protein
MTSTNAPQTTPKLITLWIGSQNVRANLVQSAGSGGQRDAFKTWFRYLVIRVRDRNGTWATHVGLSILSGLAACSHN